MAEQDERAAFEAWFANFRHGWKTEKDVAFDAFKAGAALAAKAVPADPYHEVLWFDESKSHLSPNEYVSEAPKPGLCPLFIKDRAAPALAATPAPAPLTNAQFERLYNNLPPSIQQDARSRLAFIRIGRAVEAAHGIGQGKEASK